MIKIVSSQEMARIEKRAIEQGASDETFMREAALSLSFLTEEFITRHNLKPEILLLIGKGNKGGDAYATGTFLLKRGFSVSALPVFPPEECSPLSKKMRQEFQNAHGRFWIREDFPSSGIILDGIFGTGFKGKVEGFAKEIIDGANASPLPILAIDIPSGVNGNTGAVESVAIHATETFYLELPKTGFFIQDGWNHVGRLEKAVFGLAKSSIDEAVATAYLADEKEIRKSIPPIHRTQHKYERGYVLAIAGSPQMIGAAHLSCRAALRAGAGIVRLFSPDISEPLSDEIIKVPFNPDDLTALLKECKRASSIFIGPGLGQTSATQTLLKKVMPEIVLPCVIDADALFFFDDYKQKLQTPHVILTPHHGEFQHLIRAKKSGLDLYNSALEYSNENKVTLVLKGAPTWIFQPGTIPLIIPRGDPGMATAGSGDVLTGILAALLAQHLPPREAAPLGVLLHALAGEAAASQKTSHSMIASDIIEALPQAFSALRAR